MATTYWRKAENYHTREIHLEYGFMIFKDYWDPGKNPNITRISFDDFIRGKFNYEIMMAFNGAVIKEVIENIKIIQEDEKK